MERQALNLLDAEMIWATVITDASFDDRTGKAGWAAWIRIDGVAEPIKAYGAFKGKVKTSTDAEKMAAANGLFIAQKHGADAFLVQSDCMSVIHLIEGITKARSVKDDWSKKMMAAGVWGKIIKARHVKGHSKTKDSRSYVNRWCDEMANKARKST
jgi:ribonuclease HI